MTRKDLTALTVTGLKALARKKKIALTTGAKKADLIEALLKAAGAGKSTKAAGSAQLKKATAKKPGAKKAAPKKAAAKKTVSSEKKTSPKKAAVAKTPKKKAAAKKTATTKTAASKSAPVKASRRTWVGTEKR